MKALCTRRAPAESAAPDSARVIQQLVFENEKHRMRMSPSVGFHVLVALFVCLGKVINIYIESQRNKNPKLQSLHKSIGKAIR